MKRILVIDDTKNIRMLLTKCLEHEGYQVDTASDGQEALDMFRKSRYDLAFLDIKMSKLSGTEVLKSIREIGIETPVIIITAYATVKNAVECTKLGAVTYIQKPFTAEKIRTVLSELMSRHADSCILGEADSILRESRELIDAGAFIDALEMLKGIIAKEISNPEVYFLISKAYQGMGNRESADRFYKTYLIFSN
ncbi:MAG: histidine kinase [Clostridia bacterium BRH_c25]|nr:MAG: histidine kinase [Clostridia bacterium BRH_c25]